MRHHDHALFLTALHSCKRIRITFFSKEDGGILVREAAPYDYGPSRRAKDQTDRYHFHDYTSDTGPHTVSLVPHQIQRVEILQKTFDPEALVDWDVRKSPWFVPRNWGRVS